MNKAYDLGKTLKHPVINRDIDNFVLLFVLISSKKLSFDNKTCYMAYFNRLQIKINHQKCELNILINKKFIYI
jgi:hypothetical protein